MHSYNKHPADGEGRLLEVCAPEKYREKSGKVLDVVMYQKEI
ncbi:hypothetical protein [Methanoregula sp.]|nr:hypothetical protein [Methanoregula sp.]MDD5143051.1 hypothetical protein [Methanoregula sp.]